MRGIVEAAPVPPELVPTPQPVAATSIPTFFDQLFSYTTATELLERMVEPELASYLGGVPNLDSDDFIAILGSVPLEPAIRLSTWVQRRLRLDPTNAAKQLETMELLYGPVFRAAGELLLREHPRRALFSEQQAFALQRLLRSWTILIDPTRPSDGRRPGSRALAVDRPTPFRRGPLPRQVRQIAQLERVPRRSDGVRFDLPTLAAVGSRTAFTPPERRLRHPDRWSKRPVCQPADGQWELIW